jgi:hypothetical protein
MKRNIVVAAALLSLLTLVPSAFAMPSSGPLINTGNDPCDGTSTPDECMATVSGNYATCRAYPSDGGTCIAVVITYRNNPDGTVRQVKACAHVPYSAGCQCDTVTLKTKGECSYMTNTGRG